MYSQEELPNFYSSKPVFITLTVDASALFNDSTFPLDVYKHCVIEDSSNQPPATGSKIKTFRTDVDTDSTVIFHVKKGKNTDGGYQVGIEQIERKNTPNNPNAFDLNILGTYGVPVVVGKTIGQAVECYKYNILFSIREKQNDSRKIYQVDPEIKVKTNL